MVTIVDFEIKTNKSGKGFYVLVLQGEPEIIISKTGNPYLSTSKANLSTTMNEVACKQMIGKTLPGSIIKVNCEPYEIISEEGEIISKDSRYEYQPEEVQSVLEKAVFTN
jgi:hypothetical protein